MPDDHSHRDPLGLDLAMRVLQVDRSWYERYWLEERPPRRTVIVARHLRTTLSRLRPACDHVASLLRSAMSAMVPRKKIQPGI
jgi:hypothetical protein